MKKSIIDDGFSLNSDNLLVFPTGKVLILSSHLRLPFFLLNRRIEFYNGKRFLSMIVRDYMVGCKLSDFFATKFTGPSIHSKGKSKKSPLK